MTSRRQQRVAELLHEELGLLISTELTDPRLADALVTVTRVDVSQDLHNARVYVEHALGPRESPQILAALAHSQTFLRKALVENLNLRMVPDLTFHVDETGARARRVDELLDSIAKDHGPDASA
jgi:ribosome-binding factor A